MTWNNKSILAIIPARGGSKRVKKKNLRQIGGKSLVQRAVETALECSHIDQICVSTDDDEILNQSKAYQKVIGLKRPAEISDDKAPAIAYVKHALRTIGDFDLVVILQPSSPFTLPSDISNTIKQLDFDNGVEASVSVMEVDQEYNPLKLKKMVNNSIIPFFENEKGRVAAHEIPKLYTRNGSVYVVSKKLVEKGIIISDVSNAFLMPRERSVDINTEYDLKIAEFLFQTMKDEV